LNQESALKDSAVSRLIQELNKLPGIGPKSAQRIAFHLLRSSESENQALAEAVMQVKQRTKMCSVA